MYHVSPNNTTWRKMYDIMHIAKIKYNCIEDFSVVSSTLEQLFLLFAKAMDKDNERA
jgi:ATP-binding cassette subfamily A (ABC1) protein 3